MSSTTIIVPQTQGRLKATGRQRVHDFSLKVGRIRSKCGEVEVESSDRVVLAAPFTHYNRPCFKCFPDLDGKWVPPDLPLPPMEPIAGPPEPLQAPEPAPEPAAQETEAIPAPDPQANDRMAAERRRSILGILLAAPEPLSTAGLSQRANFGRMTTRACCDELVARGCIKVVKTLKDTSFYAAVPGVKLSDADRPRPPQATIVDTEAGGTLPAPEPMLVMRPDGSRDARQQFVITWVPEHLLGQGSFTSTVKHMNQEGAIRFLRDACKPCPITIETIVVTT